MPAGLGTDTGGSVRIPAALCGIVGFRPTLVLPSGEASAFLTYIRNTGVAAVTGSPFITVPAGRTGTGLPVGLLLDAAPGADTTLLTVAERAAGVLSGREGV